MILRELRYAWRGLLLRKQRAFSIATVLTFALGIGAATAIFSIVHAVLLAPLPFGGPDRVVRLTERSLSRGLPEFSVSTPDFLTWVERAKSFDAIAALNGESVNIGTDGRYQRVQGLRASASLWRVLGMPLVAGREFTAAEDTLGGPAVAMIGERLWRSQFGADPSLVGRAVQINGENRVIVAVAPQDVGFSTDIDVWMPLTPDPVTYGRGDRRLDVVARLAGGVTVAQAQAELDAISTSLANEFPDTNLGWEGALEPIRDWIVSDSARSRLLLLLGAVVVLMLVACTNVANLQIARAAARQRELGVRQALGAARSRLVLQMVGESVLLAIVGAAIGLVLAAVALQVAVTSLPPTTPRLSAFALDWRAAIVAFAVTAGTAVAFGLAPTLLAMRSQLSALLQQLGRSTVDGQRSPIRHVLVVVQFTLATVLVIAAALLLQHYSRLQEATLGFQPEQLLVARMTRPQKDENADLGPDLAVYDRMLGEIAALPGVKSAGITSEIPFGEVNTSMSIAPGGGKLTYREDSVQASWRVVSPDYLATLGVPLLRGRGFRSEESAKSMLLSDGLARRLFPRGDDPVGQTVRLGNGQTRTVVGVVGDARQVGLGADPTLTMYMPTTWIVLPTMNLIVRSESDPAALVAPIRDIARRITPDHPLFDIGTMGGVISANVAEPRMQTMVLIAFAVASLLLAAFGVAGVMAYLVARRTPELAVRMALGATPRRLVGHVLGRGGLLCLIGVAIGSVVLSALSGAFGEAAADANLPAMFVLGASLLVAVGLFACWLPARRVARISPSLALRDE